MGLILTSRRFLGVVPRLSGRVWNDVARQLQEFLEKLKDSMVNGIPGGFSNAVPPTVTLNTSGTAGTEAAGWVAADARPALDLLLTTKGDLLTRDASIYARRGIGTDDKILTADSSDTLGLAWKAQVGALASLYPICRAFWRLEEGTGLQRLDGFGLNDLTSNNGVTQESGGKIGNAAGFVRASAQSLSITDTVQVGLEPLLGDWSVSTWIYPVTMTGNLTYYFVGKGTNSNFSPEQVGYSMALTGTGHAFPSRIQVLFGAPPTTVIGGYAIFNSVITAATWTHLVWTISRTGNLRLYINGTEVTGITDGFAATNHYGDNSGSCDTIAPFALGTNSSTAGLGAQNFDGRMDATGLFSEALTQAQVDALYASGTGRELFPFWLTRWQEQPNVLVSQVFGD